MEAGRPTEGFNEGHDNQNERKRNEKNKMNEI
jgi:hypothetical protein